MCASVTRRISSSNAVRSVSGVLDQPGPVVERHDRDAGRQAWLDLRDLGLDPVDDVVGIDAVRATTTPPTASLAPFTRDATRKASPTWTSATCDT